MQRCILIVNKWLFSSALTSFIIDHFVLLYSIAYIVFMTYIIAVSNLQDHMHKHTFIIELTSETHVEVKHSSVIT